MSKAAVDTAIRRLQFFIDTQTAVFRRRVLDKDDQVVVFDETNLINLLQLDPKNAEDRAFVKQIISKGMSWSRYAAKTVVNERGLRYAVFDNFTEVGELFDYLQGEIDRFSRKDIHRGHLTKPAVREFAEAQIDEFKGVLEKSGVLDNNIPLKKAVNDLYGKLNLVLATASPEVSASFYRRITNRINSDMSFVLIGPEAREGNLGKQGDNELKKLFAQAFDEWYNKYADGILDMPGSKSISKAAGDILEEKFLTNRITPYIKDTKGNRKGLKNKVPKPKAVYPKLRGVSGRFTNILNLKAILNTLLHDQVQGNMGKGRSQNVLNYRTGRFARSAQVTNMLHTRADRIDVYYTWQHDPYDVFLPGQSRLATPGRDPRKIIGRAIRQLAVKVLRNDIKFNPIPDNRS